LEWFGELNDNQEHLDYLLHNMNVDKSAISSVSPFSRKIRKLENETRRRLPYKDLKKIIEYHSWVAVYIDGVLVISSDFVQRVPLFFRHPFSAAAA